MSKLHLNKYSLVYTTQVNSTFRARWFASSEVISQVLYIHLRAAEEKQNGFPFQVKLLLNK